MMLFLTSKNALLKLVPTTIFSVTVTVMTQEILHSYLCSFVSIFTSPSDIKGSTSYVKTLSHCLC